MSDSALMIGQINDLVDRIHLHAVNKGFWNFDGINIADLNAKVDPEVATLYLSSKLALVHSEVSEALECLRDNEMQTHNRESDGKPEGFDTEIVDIVVRCFDILGYRNVNAGQELINKISFNETRPFMHGGKAI